MKDIKILKIFHVQVLKELRVKTYIAPQSNSQIQYNPCQNANGILHEAI